MMLRALAPSGVPIRFSDIAAGISAMISGDKAVDAFNREVCQTFGKRHSLTVSSGRAGLSLIFKALHARNPERTEVLIPAFTSFSVPSAVVNAGLKVSLYDLIPNNLSPECESLANAINEKTLCVVVCHLFGFPADMDEVINIAEKMNIPVIDDAAQAMGARYKGKWVGTFGIAGLFSLSRGKNITSVDGGVVVTNDESLAREMSSIEVAPVGRVEYLKLLIKAVVLTFLQHPRCYWFPRSIPALNIGISIFDPCFTIQCFTAFQAGIARQMLKRLDRINQARKNVSGRFVSLMNGNKLLEIPCAVAGAEPVWLRFPVIATKVRENFKFGVVRSYPHPVHQIQGIQPFLSCSGEYPGAQLLAERIVTLPTHSYVADDDLKQAAETVT